MPITDDPRHLTGSERAAVLLLSILPEQVTNLFTLMDDEEIKEISQAMSQIDHVPSETATHVFDEFTGQLTANGASHGGFEHVERMLTAALDQPRVDAIMEEIRGPAGRTMWDKLGNVNEGILAAYLKNEYPQTVAVVLSKIKPEHAARVLASLPEDYGLEVVNRMLHMEAVQREILDDIERTLRTEFMSNLARTSRRDSYEVMAEIFNGFDRATESRFLSSLEKNNKEVAERIRGLMFTFEDLTKLDPSGVQTLLRKVDKSKLALALKGASEKLRDLFFSNMSERAGNILREDMESMGPVRLRDVDESQAALVTLTRDLADREEIVLSDSKGGDDELVY